MKVSILRSVSVCSYCEKRREEIKITRGTVELINLNTFFLTKLCMYCLNIKMMNHLNLTSIQISQALPIYMYISLSSFFQVIIFTRERLKLCLNKVLFIQRAIWRIQTTNGFWKVETTVQKKTPHQPPWGSPTWPVRYNIKVQTYLLGSYLCFRQIDHSQHMIKVGMMKQDSHCSFIYIA